MTGTPHVYMEHFSMYACSLSSRRKMDAMHDTVLSYETGASAVSCINWTSCWKTLVELWEPLSPDEHVTMKYKMWGRGTLECEFICQIWVLCTVHLRAFLVQGRRHVCNSGISHQGVRTWTKPAGVWMCAYREPERCMENGCGPDWLSTVETVKWIATAHQQCKTHARCLQVQR